MRKPTPRRRRRSGFTLIEVMVSLGVMTIGAMAIIALQQHAIRTNVHARQLSMATNIGETWMERLKQDSHRWTQVGYFNQAPEPDAVAVLQNTTYLKLINTNTGIFQPIPLSTADLSPAFNYRGAPVDPTNEAYQYCTSFRPSWVWYGRAMKVDVRVWWGRDGLNTDIHNDFGQSCDDDNAKLNPGGAHDGRYHVVYLSTVIRASPLNQ